MECKLARVIFRDGNNEPFEADVVVSDASIDANGKVSSCLVSCELGVLMSDDCPTYESHKPAKPRGTLTICCWKSDTADMGMGMSRPTPAA